MSSAKSLNQDPDTTTVYPVSVTRNFFDVANNYLLLEQTLVFFDCSDIESFIFTYRICSPRINKSISYIIDVINIK